MSRPVVILTRRWPSAVEAHLAERYELVCNTQDVPMQESHKSLW